MSCLPLLRRHLPETTTSGKLVWDVNIRGVELEKKARAGKRAERQASNPCARGLGREWQQKRREKKRVRRARMARRVRRSL
jgi:hypothetical protein